ncbi:unnamed protein product [Rotaria socialis]|uniref:Uncharacterized protein n=1 Tax=Rotaria socialis TaxID=392032 RepID=A0A820HNR0_9BILA|nr:unnamed protein product [Rotaria socialis]
MTDQNIINLRSADPFADVTGPSTLGSGATGGTGDQRSSNLIHSRIQQRSHKKYFNYSSSIGHIFLVVEHQEYGAVTQLQGDQRINVSQFLEEIGICQVEQLKVHGF